LLREAIMQKRQKICNLKVAHIDLFEFKANSQAALQYLDELIEKKNRATT
jgi:hypothetical protein